MPITYSQTIQAPIEKVFDCLDDDDKLKQWITGLEETVHRPDGTFTQRIREGGRVQEYQGRTLFNQKPRYLAIQLGNRQFSVDVHYRLTPQAPAATRLDYQCDLTFRTLPARVLGTIFQPFTKMILKKQMTKLKALAESP